MRRKLVEQVAELAVTVPDADFLRIERVRAVFTEDEIQSFIRLILEHVIPHLDDIVEDWQSHYDSSRDPEEHFDLLWDTLRAYKDEFASDGKVVAAIEDAESRIDRCIVELQEDRPREDEPPYDYEFRLGRSGSTEDRSVFEDVDE